MAPRYLFRYSTWDALPALAGLGIVALIFWTFLRFSSLPVWALLICFIVVAWSYCWNMQCISHNFIHNPYFKYEWLNSAFGVLESLALGVPHVLYHHYHMNHHFGDNDRKGPDGLTKDWSSIFRYGKGDEPENFWKYILISFFRVELRPVVKLTARHRQLFQLFLESAALGFFWAAMGYFNLRYFLYFYLPSYYVGWVLSYAEGYLEHFGAKPGNQYANSVSSYNRLYNFFWFNNGYHQEHHWDPKHHWTDMKALHVQLKPYLVSNGTRTLRGPHFTAFIEDWLRGRKSKTESSTSPPGITPTAA